MILFLWFILVIVVDSIIILVFKFFRFYYFIDIREFNFVVVFFIKVIGIKRIDIFEYFKNVSVFFINVFFNIFVK